MLTECPITDILHAGNPALHRHASDRWYVECPDCLLNTGTFKRENQAVGDWEEQAKTKITSHEDREAKRVK